MNLVEILKNCPEGTKLYSPVYGDVYFQYIENHNQIDYMIVVKTNNGNHYGFTVDGRLYSRYEGECMLFPSKENKDWNTFEAKTLCNFKPFDKVLVRNEDNEPWTIQFFGYYDESAKDTRPYICLGNSEFVANTFKQCIPFEGNEKLLGCYDNI